MKIIIFNIISVISNDSLRSVKIIFLWSNVN